jgi:hypothetical protein
VAHRKTLDLVPHNGYKSRNHSLLFWPIQGPEVANQFYVFILRSCEGRIGLFTIRRFEKKQQICMFDLSMANRQQGILSLIKWHSVRGGEDQILNMDRFLQQYNKITTLG